MVRRNIVIVIIVAVAVAGAIIALNVMGKDDDGQFENGVPYDEVAKEDAPYDDGAAGEGDEEVYDEEVYDDEGAYEDAEGIVAEDEGAVASEATGDAQEIGADALGESIRVDQSGYVIANSSVDRLGEADIEGLTELELTVARNEIYARHGRLFDTPELQAYFDTIPWYQAIEGKEREVNIKGVELDNAEMMREYAEEHFGRSSYYYKNS
jgi:hypothetical protein